MQYIPPKRLKSRDKVAIVAPSSPFLTDEVQAGIDILREFDLEPVLGPCVKNLRYVTIHAAPLLERVDELNWAFSDPSIKGIFTTNGGQGAAAMLPYLNYKQIRASRKVFVGMSDTISINSAMLTKSGLINICGQNLSIRLSEGNRSYEKDCESLRDTVELLMSDKPWFDKPFRANPFIPRVVSPGEASGHVIGGNIDTFVHLIGTPYLPPVDGAILFLEDTHKTGTELDRHIIHMKLSGILDRISGIVVGEFYESPNKVEPRDPSNEEVLIDHFSTGVPCVYGYSFSHGDVTSPIPIGAQCHMNTDSGVVSFDNFVMQP